MTLKQVLAITATSVGFSLCASHAAAVTISFPNFSDTTGLSINGDTTTVSTSDGSVLRLTSATTSQAGSTFSNITINASNFSTFFRFRITSRGGDIFDCNTTTGADGLVFVAQSVSSSVGGSGFGIGYAGIDNSVGVEFDTWCNENPNLNDPDSNHLGINVDGVVDHGTGAPFTVGVTPDFDDGNIWYAWVDYDGTTLEVRANQTGNRPTTALLTRDLDIPTILGQNTAFVGFTSGTGSAFGNHDILSWEYRDSFDPIETTPEPSVLLGLLAVGTVGAVSRKRKK